MDLKTKKKHHSRKKKSAWRKHVDITDVENFLEQQRTEEILVGNVAEQQDDELFTVDDKPDTSLVTLSRKELRRLKAKEPPKSWEPLINNSKVSDPIVKRNRVRTKEERKHPIAKSKADVKAAAGIVPARVIQGQLDRVRARDQARKKPKELEFSKDLWAEEKIPEEMQYEWYNQDLVEHTMRNLGKPIVKAPNETHKKRSQLKAVTIPHAGLSYNPTFDDHQELMGEVLKKEETLMKREERLERLTTRKYSKMSAEQAAAMQRKELIQGLPIDKSKENRQQEEASDDEYRAVNAPVRNKKKDKRTRRKQMDAKKRRALEDIAKHEVKKIKDINKVPSLKKEITEHDDEVEQKRKNHEKRLKEKKTSARKLGRIKFREPEIDINQLEDISGNMRNLKPEGNLLLDRFKSLQKRNILPAGVLRKTRRKTLVKKFIKKSHKGEDIKTKNKIKPPKSSR